MINYVKHIRLVLIGIIIFTLIINMIYLKDNERIGLFPFISLFMINFFALFGGLIQFLIYLEDEIVKKEIHSMYQRQNPPSIEELREEFEKIFNK